MLTEKGGNSDELFCWRWKLLSRNWIMIAVGKSR